MGPTDPSEPPPPGAGSPEGLPQGEPPAAPRRLPKRGEPPPIGELLGRLGELGRVAAERLAEQGRQAAESAPRRLGPRGLSGEAPRPPEGSPSSGASAAADPAAGAPQAGAGAVPGPAGSGPANPGTGNPGPGTSGAAGGEARRPRSARRSLQQAFDERRGELEDLAVKSLTRALREEAHTLEALIDRAVAVKKREVRLSLLVLVASALLYVALELLFP
jgi:hypothetical protein